MKRPAQASGSGSHVPWHHEDRLAEAPICKLCGQATPERIRPSAWVQKHLLLGVVLFVDDGYPRRFHDDLADAARKFIEE
eukprot:664593-Prorocentrum_lima.AAC.1